jgi:uncharacterized DUF497 family protein
LWLDEQLIEIGRVIYDREERQLFVGALKGRCWTAIVTFRDGRIRIILVRRARRREEMAYQCGGV